MQDHRKSNVGKLIRAMRHQLALTQEGLAHSAALSKSTVEAVERGTGHPRASTVRAIVSALRADPNIFSASFRGETVLALPTRAPRTVGDLIPVFEAAQQGDALSPQITEPALEAVANDACLFFQQMTKIYAETPVEDQTTYLGDLLDLLTTLRKAGWAARIGCYSRSLAETKTKKTLETVGVLRLLPIRHEGPVIFITSPPVADVADAERVT